MAASQPRIGVTRWEDVPGERIEDYWERIEEAGGEPLDLRGKEIDVATLDGLVVTGGLDIAPERYGDAPHPKTKTAEPERDEYELRLLHAALAAGLPVLCICRGCQLLNVARGGGLLQHIEDRSHVADYRTEVYPSQWHKVRLAPDSRLHAIYRANEIETNSRHHQAIIAERLAPTLIAVGTAPDGIIEAVESREHSWVAGVQWHPERPERDHPAFRPGSQPLFDALVQATMRARERVR
ncbi:MAG: gamma-glutamyl-gamma-aminobutyrate hydrolase family protein [Dehalococcoidia bacterium]